MINLSYQFELFISSLTPTLLLDVYGLAHLDRLPLSSAFSANMFCFMMCRVLNDVRSVPEHSEKSIEYIMLCCVECCVYRLLFPDVNASR